MEAVQPTRLQLWKRGAEFSPHSPGKRHHGSELSLESSALSSRICTRCKPVRLQRAQHRPMASSRGRLPSSSRSPGSCQVKHALLCGPRQQRHEVLCAPASPQLVHPMALPLMAISSAQSSQQSHHCLHCPGLWSRNCGSPSSFKSSLSAKCFT